ncbi:PAQR family membrane homeostasis protein TrhA [Candidatus Enterovibrio altilux]|uniref:Membrane protein n=1 Tax=Candidatus Enterovibrio altilux TaxID=1927128 RepID=A0A291B9J1_9GAMM|nr:hemolysin III family protein [Candidatus Enterovibrio luxaltus]ATF09651.1 membrane protein [Candidatus Enterovibrio luxaltus]
MITVTPTKSKYSIKEEIASSVSHCLGIVFGVFGLIFLLIKAFNAEANTLTITSYSVYGISIILLYFASTLYHAISSSNAKHTLKIFDHCAIYLLIAGTHTPFMLISLRTPLAVIIMTLIWSIALVGVTLKIFFIYHFNKLSLVIYLVMGWLSLSVIYQLAQVVAIQGLLLLLAGGIVYSSGVIFYVKRTIPYNHAIWHLFVLGGTVLHFLAIYYYIQPV